MTQTKFKRITGGDIITARAIGVQNTAQFIAGKILIQTQNIPSFTKIDGGLKRRIVVIEFPYNFTEDEEKIKNNPSVFKLADNNLKTEFSKPVYRRAFIDMLFEYYKLYLKEGLIIPPSVKAYTNSYFC